MKGHDYLCRPSGDHAQQSRGLQQSVQEIFRGDFTDRKVQKRGDGATTYSGFDWETYLAYNPDLKAKGIYGRAQAWQHFQLQGKAENRKHMLPQLAIRYTVCSGLMNQQYSHIAAFVLAKALRATKITLPPALTRDSFQSTFEQIEWTPVPVRELLDVDRIKQLWAVEGITVLEVC